MISLYRETNNKKYLKLAKKFASKIKSWASSEVSSNDQPMLRLFLRLTFLTLRVESERDAL
jgi:hypothetical protein